jgi:hypothetical protein
MFLFLSRVALTSGRGIVPSILTYASLSANKFPTTLTDDPFHRNQMAVFSGSVAVTPDAQKEDMLAAYREERVSR